MIQERLQRFVVSGEPAYGSLRAPFAVTWRGSVLGCGTDGIRLLAIEGAEAANLPLAASFVHDGVVRMLDLTASEAARRATIDLATFAAFAGTPPAPTVVCTRCGGEGRVTCDECRGSGNRECECSSCGDTHDADCDVCAGGGNVRCAACRGHRETRREYVLVGELLLDRGVLASALEDAELVTGPADLVVVRTAEPSPLFIMAPFATLLVMPVRREEGQRVTGAFALPPVDEVLL